MKTPGRSRSPAKAKANASNVKSLLENLPKLSLSEAINESKDEYDRWGVSDEKALHATFFKGQDIVFDVYFGENGSRGQMTRLAKQDGVYAIKGFSKWLYERDAKGWRDKSMLKFDDKEVVKVQIQNPNGVFVFDKAGEGWTGKHGKAVAQAKPIDKFQSSKVDDLLRAYKALAAIDFGDGKQPADVGPGAARSDGHHRAEGWHRRARAEGRQSGGGHQPLGAHQRLRSDLQHQLLVVGLGDRRRQEVPGDGDRQGVRHRTRAGG